MEDEIVTHLKIYIKQKYWTNMYKYIWNTHVSSWQSPAIRGQSHKVARKASGQTRECKDFLHHRRYPQVSHCFDLLFIQYSDPLPSNS